MAEAACAEDNCARLPAACTLRAARRLFLRSLLHVCSHTRQSPARWSASCVASCWFAALSPSHPLERSDILLCQRHFHNKRNLQSHSTLNSSAATRAQGAISRWWRVWSPATRRGGRQSSAGCGRGHPGSTAQTPKRLSFQGVAGEANLRNAANGFGSATDPRPSKLSPNCPLVVTFRYSPPLLIPLPRACAS